ncbi:MAG: hypothetical protein V3V20_07500 [Algisphaera sp.]
MIAPGLGILAAVWVGGAVAWLVLTWLTTRWSARPAKGVSTRGAAGVIVAVAILLRALPVGLLPVSLSDDIWRYVHDGRTLARGENPYVRSPAEDLARAVAGNDVAAAQALKNVNNPELVTIYQPASQWLFAATAWGVQGVWEQAPAQVHARVLRGAFAAIDLLIVVLLLLELRRRRASPWWSTLYAWSPAVFLETTWAGHQDGLGVLAVVATLMLAGHAKRLGSAMKRGTWIAVLAGMTLAIAVAVKPVALPLALPLAWSLRSRPKRMACAAAACVATLMAFYLPFFFMEGGMAGMLETSRRFMADWRFNGAIHPLLEALAKAAGLGGQAAKSTADSVCAVALAGVLGVATFRLRDLWQVTLIYFALLVGLSSTVHPWYLLWALGVLPVARAGAARWGPATAATWTAALALPWGYVAWLEVAAGRGYTVSVGVQVLCWTPILIAAGVGWRLRRGD